MENPSADRGAKSVYDNVPKPPENIYKALDPAKRELSVKYESLIKPSEHEVGADGYNFTILFTITEGLTISHRHRLFAFS